MKKIITVIEKPLRQKFLITYMVKALQQSSFEITIFRHFSGTGTAQKGHSEQVWTYLNWKKGRRKGINARQVWVSMPIIPHEETASKFFRA